MLAQFSKFSLNLPQQKKKNKLRDTPSKIDELQITITIRPFINISIF